MTIPGEGVDINSRTPTTGCSLIQDYFGEAFHPHSIPCNLGEGQKGIHHQQWQKNISGEAIPMVILVWWPPSVAMINPRWMLPMHPLPYINVTSWSQMWL